MWKKDERGKWVQAVIGNRRGGSTLEYIIILSAALILALILYGAMSDTIKPKLESVIPKIIRGEEVEIATGSGVGSEKSGTSKEANTNKKKQSFQRTKERPHGTVRDVDLTDRQLRAAAELAYDKGEKHREKWMEELGKGWEENEDLFMDKNGFQGRVFVNEETKQVIISYRGTDEPGDYWTDAKLAVGLNANDDIAREFYQRAMAEYPDYQFIQVGHSLGGYYGQKMALENKIPTFTFNAPGVQSMKLKQTKENMNGKYDDLVINHSMRKDQVGTYGTHVGRIYHYDDNGPRQVDDYSLYRRYRDLPTKKVPDFIADLVTGFSNHGVDNFDDHLQGDYLDVER